MNRQVIAPVCKSSFGLAWVSVALLFVACGTTESQVGPEPQAAELESGIAGMEPEQAILTLEATRSTGKGALQRFLRDGDAQVRAQAALALGRLPYPEFTAEVSDALHAALSDPSADVRAAAAFGIGLRADPASADALSAAWDDPEPVVRARVVEAASRLSTDALRQEIMYRLFSDPSFRVRAEAAVAAHRWPVDAEGAAEVDNALARVALAGFEGPDEESEQVARRPEAPEVVWRALFSLQRRAWARAELDQRDQIPERAREALLHWARPEARGESRLFAVKGLGALPGDERVREALFAGLDSDDWRVASEAARGLGQMHHPEALARLDRAFAHPSVHVRQMAAEALGTYGEEREAVDPLLGLAQADRSPNVRASALVALAKLDGDAAKAELSERSLDTDMRVREGVVRACRHLSSEVAVPILVRMSGEEETYVAYRATEALGNHLNDEARGHLRELALGKDNGLRLAALEALAKEPRAEDIEVIESCWASSTGEIAAEIRVQALQIAGKIGTPEAIALLQRGLSTGGFYERRVARQALVELDANIDLPPIGPPPRLMPPAALQEVSSRPTIELVTSRGTMVFELLPDIAPLHVRNFLQLAKADYYDGLGFHRVVADFAIQGGDYRGDGSGGDTWSGAVLPAEFGPRKFDRGALGMPRNSDPESGGSQIFVTHRPTPHLDGRYTLFGELRQGFDVLDLIEIGDTIVDVRLRGARP